MFVLLFTPVDVHFFFSAKKKRTKEKTLRLRQLAFEGSSIAVPVLPQSANAAFNLIELALLW
ncbi:hypothetical protein ACFQZX_04635 [Mucilaginibacter litoreus]|uniref:Uncharacterized protein n=1 Tax=Mucilaginibacter litoreus TaxID=1048221 RepID=A0ABW3APW7_9SPHI